MKRWTHQDESALRDLQARKQATLKETREPIAAIINALDLAVAEHVVNEIVDELINRADQVRDALEPFDSGVRCAERLSVG